MKMETAGHPPGDQILDQVMNLYLLDKSQRSQKSTARPTIAADALTSEVTACGSTTACDAARGAGHQENQSVPLGAPLRHRVPVSFCVPYDVQSVAHSRDSEGLCRTSPSRSLKSVPLATAGVGSAVTSVLSAQAPIFVPGVPLTASAVHELLGT